MDSSASSTVSVASGSNAWDNEQVLRFCLLVNILSKAGFCTSDARIAMSRFFKSLPRKSQQELAQVLPLARHITDDFIGFEASLEGIQRLSATGAENRIPLPCLALALAKAKHRFVTQPAWSIGPNGWLTWMGHNLSRQLGEKQKDAHGKPIPGSAEWFHNFGLAELSACLWIAVVARLRLMIPQRDWDSATKNSTLNSIYRESLWHLFKVSPHSGCTCTDDQEVLASADLKKVTRLTSAQAKYRVEERLSAYLDATGVNTELGKMALNPGCMYDGTIQKPTPLPEAVFTELHWEHPAFRVLCRDLGAKAVCARENTKFLVRQASDAVKALEKKVQRTKTA